MKTLSKKIENIAKDNQNDFLLTVGGDHSIGSATISGMLSRHPNLKVIWVDAHADMVDPSLRIRDPYNYHGMPLSHVAGIFKLNGFEWMNLLPKENIVLIGIRDIEEGEFQTIMKHNIKAFTMDHVDKYGIGNVMKQAIEYLDPKGDAPFHISFDVDGLDPDVFNQTGTLFRYGLTPREGCHIIRRVAHERKLVSLDLVEVNSQINSSGLKRPKYREEEHYHDVSHSIGIGIDLIESVFTKYQTI